MASAGRFGSPDMNSVAVRNTFHKNPWNPAQGEPSEEIIARTHNLANTLDLKLGPEYLATRSGAGNSKMTYIEAHKASALANEVFGYNGWSSETRQLLVDFEDQDADNGRWTCGVTAVVRITLIDGVFHEDVGFGKMENCKSRPDALEKAKKEAVTDATKRALRLFGNVMGNCLYDKEFLKDVSHVKAMKIPFSTKQLYRPSLPGDNIAESSGSHINTAQPVHPPVKAEQSKPLAPSHQPPQRAATAPYVSNKPVLNKQPLNAPALTTKPPPVQHQPVRAVPAPMVQDPMPDSDAALMLDADDAMFAEMEFDNIEVFKFDSTVDDSGFIEGDVSIADIPTRPNGLVAQIAKNNAPQNQFRPPPQPQVQHNHQQQQQNHAQQPRQLNQQQRAQTYQPSTNNQQRPPQHNPHAQQQQARLPSRHPVPQPQFNRQPVAQQPPPNNVNYNQSRPQQAPQQANNNPKQSTPPQQQQAQCNPQQQGQAPANNPLKRTLMEEPSRPVFRNQAANRSMTTPYVAPNAKPPTGAGINWRNNGAPPDVPPGGAVPEQAAFTSAKNVTRVGDNYTPTPDDHAALPRSSNGGFGDAKRARVG